MPRKSSQTPSRQDRPEPLRFAPETRGQNFFALDRNLQQLLRQRAPDFLDRYGETLTDFGEWVAGPLDRQAAYSDRIAPPRLEAFDAQGEARHRVIYNSDYLASLTRRRTVPISFLSPWAICCRTPISQSIAL